MSVCVASRRRPSRPILGDPVPRVIDDESADEIRAGPVEIDGAAPRRRVQRRDVGGVELGQVGALGPEVVVDDVEDHGEVECVRGIDQFTQIVGAAVGARRCVEADAVIAPVPASWKIGDRHQLDGGDPERAQVRQTGPGPGERALGCEGADVQLVDDELGEPQRPAQPVLPLVRPRIDDFGGSMHTLRLIARRRIRPQRNRRAQTGSDRRPPRAAPRTPRCRDRSTAAHTRRWPRR